MSKATGWAVVDVAGVIDVKTVSDTRREALVNWLAVGVSLLALRDSTDAQVEHMWEANRGARRAVRVTIEVAEGPRGAADATPERAERPNSPIEMLRMANERGEIGYTFPDASSPAPLEQDDYWLVEECFARRWIEWGRWVGPVGAWRPEAIKPQSAIYRLTRLGEAVLTQDDPNWRRKAAEHAAAMVRRLVCDAGGPKIADQPDARGTPSPAPLP